MRDSDTHVLDRPIWSALTTTQRDLAEGDGVALRYPVEVAPFAAMADSSPQSFASLGALMSPSDRAVLFTTEAVAAPADFKIVLSRTGEQMVGSAATAPAGNVEIVRLGAPDVPAMMALTALTKPGPFSLRTHELGTFLGIKIGGALAAMIGERMKPAGYTEITAVCVDPAHRGHGFGQILLSAMSDHIRARGDLPFLHVFSDNDAAIALYRRQGMTIRRRMHVTVIRKQA